MQNHIIALTLRGHSGKAFTINECGYALTPIFQLEV
jgi:hypothetical protein